MTLAVELFSKLENLGSLENVNTQELLYLPYNRLSLGHWISLWKSVPKGISETINIFWTLVPNSPNWLSLWGGQIVWVLQVGTIIISKIAKMHFLLHFLVVSELCGGSDDCSGAWEVPRMTLFCASPYENHPQSHLEGTAAHPGGAEHPGRMTSMNAANVMLVIYKFISLMDTLKKPRAQHAGTCIFDN